MAILPPPHSWCAYRRHPRQLCVAVARRASTAASVPATYRASPASEADASWHAEGNGGRDWTRPVDYAPHYREATRWLDRSAYEAERIRGNQDDLAARPAITSRTFGVEPMSDSGHEATTSNINVG